jgi:competence protein ComEC
LLAVDPDTVAISCGRDNSYGHPHQVILDRFRALGIPARVTAWEGDIEETW